MLQALVLQTGKVLQMIPLMLATDSQMFTSKIEVYSVLGGFHMPDTASRGFQAQVV